MYHKKELYQVMFFYGGLSILRSNFEQKCIVTVSFVPRNCSSFFFFWFTKFVVRGKEKNVYHSQNVRLV